MHERTPRPRVTGAIAGATAAGWMIGATQLLHNAAGFMTLQQVTSGGVLRLVPGTVFGYVIDGLQEKARPLFLLGLSVAIIVAGALAGVALALWRAGAEDRATGLAGRRPRAAAAMRALACSVVLWAISMPFVLLGNQSVLSGATVTVFAEWLAVALLTEAALSLPGPASRRRAAAGAGAADEPHDRQAQGRKALVGPITARREFIEAVGGAAALATLGYLGARAARAAAPSLAESAGIGKQLHQTAPHPTGTRSSVFGDLSGITPTADFYIVSKNIDGDPMVDGKNWALRVEGDKPYSLSLGELLAEPHVEQVQTLECISNYVGGSLISTGVWKGVPLHRLLERAGVPSGTVEIAFGCVDGYTESLPLEVALQPSTLVADHLNGGRLPDNHGYPARILVADRYGMKNPKWLTVVRPVNHPVTGYWEGFGWSDQAIVNTTSRIDYPLNTQALKAGELVPARGIAYAGDRGISKVEISLSGGSTWQPVTVHPAASRFAWSIWTFPWVPARGDYTLVVRATDGQGNLQVASRSRGTFPNGPFGLANVLVTVT
ncbi:MAG TPA: molybdopterin-dependent oxidoreductase [Acidimicrobiales bacterium]|nr:molybdopterin-dependent oxidoreductase [Acidimicrobiales bacterium]